MDPAPEAVEGHFADGQADPVSEEISLDAFRLRSIPLGATPGWLKAAEAQEGQCGHFNKPRRVRGGYAPARQCERYLNGGERMYLNPDNVLMCWKHFSADRLERKKAPK